MVLPAGGLSHLRTLGAFRNEIASTAVCRNSAVDLAPLPNQSVGTTGTTVAGPGVILPRLKSFVWKRMSC